MSKCASSFMVCRVSSQAIMSASFNTRSARSEISSKLPIGVETTYRQPFVAFSAGVSITFFLAIVSRKRPRDLVLRSQRQFRDGLAVFSRVGCPVVHTGRKIAQHGLAATYGRGERSVQLDFVSF